MALEAAIVTGAGRGIGRAIALDLAARGMHVVCVSKSKNAEQTRAEIERAGGSGEAMQIDLNEDPEKISGGIREWASRGRFARLGAVLAAGILGPVGPLESSNLREWQACFQVNVLGNLAVAQGLLPAMLEAKFGRILAFSGGGSAYAYPILPAYSASKTAVVRAVENLHKDLEDKGDFAVACLAPGAVETDILKRVREIGAEVKTVTDIAEPVRFAREFLTCTWCGFSGRFVHVRDNWAEYLNNGRRLEKDTLWTLRRVEQ